MPRGANKYDEARLQRRLWSPFQLRPALWFDASDISTLSFSGNNLTEWRDKSGNGRNASPSVNPPTLATNLLNGLNVISFNNTSVTQTVTGAYSYTDTDITLISLANTQRTASGRTVYPRLWSFNATGQQDYDNTAGILLAYGYGTVNNLCIYRNSAIIAQSTLSTTSTWAFHIGTKRGGDGTISTNGEDIISGTTSNTALGFDTFRIGNDATGSDSGMNGFIAENIVIPYAVTLKEQKLIEGYLAWKWDLVYNLSTSHPFKNRPPVIGD
jgi:hypothetical protein